MSSAFEDHFWANANSKPPPSVQPTPVSVARNARATGVGCTPLPHLPLSASQPSPSVPQPPNQTKLAKLTTPEVDAPLQPRAEVWRVVPTANASYFNLGGHIDKNGIVDSLASGYLRDALKSHSKCRVV
jgi:hypothetical protein